MNFAYHAWWKCRIGCLCIYTLRIFQNIMISADVATATSTHRGRTNAKKVTSTLQPKQMVVGVSAIVYPSCRLIRAGKVGKNKAIRIVVMWKYLGFPSIFILRKWNGKTIAHSRDQWHETPPNIPVVPDHKWKKCLQAHKLCLRCWICYNLGTSCRTIGCFILKTFKEVFRGTKKLLSVSKSD